MDERPDSRLAQLAEAYWEARLDADPLTATAIGDRRRDDRLPDITPDGRVRRCAQLTDMAATATTLDDGALSGTDRITLEALRESLTTDLAFVDAELNDMTVDPLEGPQVALLNVPSYQPLASAEQADAYARRVEAMGSQVDDHAANLRRGLAAGRVSVAVLVERVIAELDMLLARPAGEWPLATHAAEDGALRVRLEQSILDGLTPAFERYRTCLVNEILPASRDEGHPGLGHVPNGAASYRALVRGYTTIEATPEELHELGRQEVERIDTELRDLGARLLGTDTLQETLRALRSDPELHFAAREEVAAVAEASLRRAEAAVSAWFGRLPSSPCEVVRMQPHEEAHSTIAYYRDPAADGSRAGQYWINTSEPATRPRYEAEALAFHESVPGHHLQVALAQEIEGLPAFRRHSLVTAYVEGWGLYSERLAGEMGLYSGDLDRFGIASFDAWRACRLVVDTGMHALGWSRPQAIAFMTEHTALGENNIANEVDRYIAWPGQALAYKVGQLELLRLRTEARERQGDRFDIRAFHDAVLDGGALPLPVLRQVVEARLP
ncbi:MAG: DUF885 domain-containing protein [Chloroflexota bacterium]